MKRSSLSALIGLVIVVALLAWYLLGVREDGSLSQGSAGASDARAVNDHNLAKNPSASVAKSDVASRTGAALPIAASTESELAFQVAELTAAVARLESATDRLDARITRSRLAVPPPEERKSQVQRAEARLEQLRKSVAQKQDKARGIARAKGIELDAKLLLKGSVPERLENDPGFVSARDEALAEQRVVAAFEKQLAELRFTMVVDALPGENATTAPVREPEPTLAD